MRARPRWSVLVLVPWAVIVSLSWLERPGGACPCKPPPNGPTLPINASVLLSCTVSTATLAFGAYDPLVQNQSTALDGTGTLLVTCTNDLPGTITLDQGQNPETGSTDAAPLRRMADGSGHFLRYSLFQDSAHSVVWGNTPETADCGSGTQVVYGRVAAGQNMPVGAYTDTVVITVNI